MRVARDTFMPQVPLCLKYPYASIASKPQVHLSMRVAREFLYASSTCMPLAPLSMQVAREYLYASKSQTLAH
jgi:hypothetical protein